MACAEQHRSTRRGCWPGSGCWSTGKSLARENPTADVCSWRRAFDLDKRFFFDCCCRCCRHCHSVVIQWMDFMSDHCQSSAASAERHKCPMMTNRSPMDRTWPPQSPRISFDCRQEEFVEKTGFRKEWQDAEGEHVAAKESARSQEVRRLSRDVGRD